MPRPCISPAVFVMLNEVKHPSQPLYLAVRLGLRATVLMVSSRRGRSLH